MSLPAVENRRTDAAVTIEYGRIAELFPDQQRGTARTVAGRWLPFSAGSVVGGRFGRLRTGSIVRLKIREGPTGPVAIELRPERGLQVSQLFGGGFFVPFPRYADVARKGAGGGWHSGRRMRGRG